VKIQIDDLSGPGVQCLLADHLQGMAEHSPPESIHAFDLEKLRATDVTFWTVREHDKLLGCGALKELDSLQGEIKSMRTAAAHLGKGVASLLVRHIIATAKERGYERLSLETGSGPAFEPAHSLYLKFGFEFCGPFADYGDDPFSRFMTLRLSSCDGRPGSARP
jgi:putative acetyltransferase